MADCWTYQKSWPNLKSVTWLQNGDRVTNKHSKLTRLDPWKKITGKNQLTTIYFDMLWLHCKKSHQQSIWGCKSFWSSFTWMCVCRLCPWLMSMEDMKVEVLHTPEVELWTLASLLCWSSISHLRRFRHMILSTWQSQLFTKPCHNRDTQLAESDAGISIQSQGILEVFILFMS